MRFMWLTYTHTHTHTYVCFRLNKMAAMVIDKIQQHWESCSVPSYCPPFCLHAKRDWWCFEGLEPGQSGSGGDTLSVWLASKELWVIVAAKLNDEKFSLAKLQAQLPTLATPSVTASVVHLIDEMINIWSCLPLSAASARKNCNKLLLRECWGHYYCVIIKAFLMLNVKCRTDKQPQLSMQQEGGRMPRMPG